MCLASVIIVNWNGRGYLEECLASVLAQDFADFEVVVVDNGSSDDSVTFVRDRYPGVKLICLAENRGFTGGNIAGYQAARGRFIALLNNDTRVDRCWLSSLVAAMQAQPHVGICASRILIDGTDLIDSAGDLMTTAFSGTKVGHGQPASLFAAGRTVHGGCAAAILYRRDMLDDIGFLDDDFFFNHEDTDLNLRAWLTGWQCVYVPSAIVHHKVSASVGHLSARTVYYFARNTLWVWLKNTPAWFMFRFLPQRILYELSSALYFCLIVREWRPFLRGKWHSLLGVGKMLKKRTFIQAKVRLSRRQIANDLVPITRYLKARRASL